MRILYGVQGTGNGHICRSRLMAKALKQANVEVDYLFSGREADQYFAMEDFGDYQLKSGVTIVSNAGKVEVAKTLRRNFSSAFFSDIRNLDLSNYDLVLNDYEPITAWAARRQKVPSIGISHQAALLHSVPKVGVGFMQNLLLEKMAPVDVSLGCHWHHFGCPIIPPFVDEDAVNVEYSHKVIVYLPFEAPDQIVQFLNDHNDYQFLVYHGQKPTVELPEHVVWHGFDRTGFKQNLTACGGVICNAGFELVSEALTLGKRILVKPLLGQFEQLSNMAALQLLAAADSMMTLDKSALTRWLKIPQPETVEYPDVATSVVNWIKQGQWQDKQTLSDELWQQAKLPASWR
ncbi:MAG: MJ1255/VC2487 family glycosyltransferase [Parashewanella sp.]